MRRYMLVVKATPEIEAGTFPDTAFEAESAKYIGELASAGALVACDRLQPSSQGKRVHYKAGKFTVTDGPFAETKELVAGYCLIRAASLEEAVAWGDGLAAVGAADARPAAAPSGSVAPHTCARSSLSKSAKNSAKPASRSHLVTIT